MLKLLTCPLLPGSLLSVVLAAGAGLAVSHFHEAGLHESGIAFMETSGSEKQAVAPEHTYEQTSAIPSVQVRQPALHRGQSAAEAAPAKPSPHEFVEDFPTTIPGL